MGLHGLLVQLFYNFCLGLFYCGYSVPFFCFCKIPMLGLMVLFDSTWFIVSGYAQSGKLVITRHSSQLGSKQMSITAKGNRMNIHEKQCILLIPLSQLPIFPIPPILLETSTNYTIEPIKKNSDINIRIVHASVRNAINFPFPPIPSIP